MSRWRFSPARSRGGRVVSMPSRSRKARPALEGLEGRCLMAGSTFSFTGGSGIASEVVTHGPNGQEELFVRLASNNAVYEYSYASGQFANTGGYLDQMVASDGGIVGVVNGYLFQYQDNSGYTYLNASGVASAVVTHNPSGQEEVFTRIAGNNAIYEYNFATRQNANTGGFLETMVADDNGITGTSGGSVAYLYHYQDGGGFYYTGGNGISSYAVTHNQSGQEVVFARLASNGGIYYYYYGTHQWINTGGNLDQLVANAHGITGTLGGYLFYYDFSPNYDFTGAGNITSIVVSHDPIGREEVFAGHSDGTFFSYVYSAHEWHTPGYKLDQMVADDSGVTGTNGGSAAYLYLYRDPTTDLTNVGSDYLLHNSYSGSFNDRYSHIVFSQNINQTGTNNGHISLTITSAVQTLIGYDIQGTITVTDSSGYFDYSEPFLGHYDPYSLTSTYPATVVVENVGAYGGVPPGGFYFRFLFQVTSQGNLTVSNNTPYHFRMSYQSSNEVDSDDGGLVSAGSNATLNPTS